MRPAVSRDRGIVTLAIEDKKAIRATFLRAGAAVKGPVPFETTGQITVLPVTCEAFYKRRLTAEEATRCRSWSPDSARSTSSRSSPAPYVTTTVFAGGRPEPGGFDLVARAGDQSLWLALLAQEPELVDQVRTTLGGNPEGGQQILNVGVVPALDVPALFEEIGPRAQVPHTWEITFLDDEGELDYITLEEDGDSTAGLTNAGRGAADTARHALHRCAQQRPAGAAVCGSRRPAAPDRLAGSLQPPRRLDQAAPAPRRSGS